MEELNHKSKEELINQLRWYKKTYENRSIFGIIKDRFFKALNIGFKRKETIIAIKPVELFSEAHDDLNNGIHEYENYSETKTHYNIDDYIIDDVKYFDAEYYYDRYLDVKNAGIDPLEHYLLHGWREGRDPSGNFNTDFYLSEYPDVKNTDMCPLTHYIFYGKAEGRINSIYYKQNTVYPNFEYRLQKAREQLNIVPYFHNNYTFIELKDEIKSKKICVHLHLYYVEMANFFIEKLNNINTPFTLFISITDKKAFENIKSSFKSKIKNLEKIEVVVVENKGRDIAPLIVTFGKKLLKFDYILHIHSKKSPHYNHNKSWRDEIIDTLLGSETIINQNLNLLNGDGKFIFNEPNININLYNNGWSDNKIFSEEILSKYSNFDIDDFPVIDFAHGSMFWAKSEAVKDFLELPFSYDDFPEEPIEPDGTICHALERLLLIFTTKYLGKAYCVYSKNYSDGLGYYEVQEDFSTQPSKHKNVKVLSYYLPQFHPTPENDEWHGKGFTEWTKVAAANPLFYNHYQQHIPHETLGFYHLNSSDILKQQAEMMKKAKVYGQIFYHYWFTGKLILEKPAKMLLENKDIDMPFCFCWANENWTKRWDGNDNEILLEQKYSKEDAAKFIQYLMPFFKDKRYIRIDNRPVLYIYRPSSFPSFKDYKNVWEAECKKEGIPPIYLVSTLTRGALSPEEYDMDAAVERVLHDWTGGICPEKKTELSFFNSFNGTVLDYNDVAEYYEENFSQKKFTCFRSIVPIWDNTARYNEDAYIVHNSTPARFQKWLDKIVEYTTKNLPDNKQFVVVNAWNEWAEGAHLEPDVKYGYAYLNSVGRALSSTNLSQKSIMLGDESVISKKIKIWINIHELCSDKFVCKESKEKMFDSFKKSNLFDICDVYVNNLELFNSLKGNKKVNYSEKSEGTDYTLMITDLVIFASENFANLLKMAIKYPSAYVLGNLIYKRYFDPLNMQDDFSIRSHHQLFPVKLYNNNVNCNIYKVRIDTMFYLLNDDYEKVQLKGIIPIVSTVIRFHKNGKYDLLERALFSLATQASCIVQPLIMLQDLNEEGIRNIEKILNKISWKNAYKPMIYKYKSNELVKDLRSKMLNDGLKNATTRYLTFLDFDDFLYPFAYKWLLNRLAETNKAISYGNVYATQYHLYYEDIVSKELTYEYGTDYKGFVNKNHSPIHSMMIDLSKIDKKKIKYFDGQKYMEDYYLTLQIVTENNTDWESLTFKKYIGDYMHFIDEKINSLAIHDSNILQNEEYMKCEEKIHQLRLSLNAAKK